MNDEGNYLEHTGIVVNSQKGLIKISLTGPGCTACHNSLCMLGESKAKEVEFISTDHSLNAGDEVIVKINPASGYTAVILLYFLPFIFMLLALLVMLRSGFNDGIAGLTSLLILVPYFSFLFLFKNTLKQQCTIDVEKR